jgi:hypothetical protein
LFVLPNLKAHGVLTAFRLFRSIPSVLQVQLFDLRSRPRCPSQELQAGLDARIIIKASDIDDLPHFLPPMMLRQLGKHHFQRDTVKRIFMLLVAHSHPIFNKESGTGHLNYYTIPHGSVRGTVLQFIGIPQLNYESLIT